MHQIVVGVLRGGPSGEHEVSLKSGHAILSHLPSERFIPRDIYIDKKGVWHDRGLPTTPGRILPTIDVAIVAVHGAYGHDGEAQKVLERFGVPYVGPDPHHSFRASHKALAKEVAREAGIPTARYFFAEDTEKAEQAARDAVRTFLQPVVVKPVDSGSSLGVTFARGFKEVSEAMQELFSGGARGVLIEERLRGAEATVGVVEGLRGEELYTLPTIEIIPPEGHGFFCNDAKYDDATQEVCPGRFAPDVSDTLKGYASTMHKLLGQRHYSRSDFIITKRGVYFLETNPAAAVGMTDSSLMPKALASVGVKLEEFLEHVIDLAHKR